MKPESLFFGEVTFFIMIKLSVLWWHRGFVNSDVSSHESAHWLGPGLKELTTACKNIRLLLLTGTRFSSQVSSFLFFFLQFLPIMQTFFRSLLESVFRRGFRVLSLTHARVLELTCAWAGKWVRRSQWWCSCSERSWSGCWKGSSSGVLPESLPCAADPWNK